MIAVAPQLTDVGKSMLMRCIGGEKITFTRFKIGNGEAAGGAVALNDLVNPLLEFGISKITTDNEGYVELSGSFASEDIDSDFRWTELGLFARMGDEAEHLYAYACDPENASLLKKGGADVMIEQSVSVIVAVGTAQNVTALISASSMYASKTEFDEHVQASNPHKITAEMLGLGNVPNVGTNDQKPTFTVPASEATQEIQSGDNMSVLLGKIARAIRNLISHIANKSNPHAVTAEQISAAKKEHQHSAADINSGTLNAERGGTGVTSYDALKTKLGMITGFVCGTYVGNGNKEQTIKVGFTPTFVAVLDNRVRMCENGVHYGGILGAAGDGTYVDTANGYMMPWPGGFVVSQYEGFAEINKAGVTYTYVAIRKGG